MARHAYEKDDDAADWGHGKKWVLVAYLGEKIGRDAPGWHIDNYEIGFKTKRLYLELGLEPDIL